MGLHFPGIYHELIDLMSDKLEDLPVHQRTFSLVCDEMALKNGSSFTYDIKTQSNFGNCSLPGYKDVPATKALVFKIASIGGTRLKQTIGNPYIF